MILGTAFETALYPADIDRYTAFISVSQSGGFARLARERPTCDFVER